METEMEMEMDAYLERLAYAGARRPAAETLRQLHRAHMRSAPFENLDIPLGRPIGLELPALYDKIVRRRRGGFCYELNGLFAWLLEQLGFPVTLLSARVWGEHGWGIAFDHLALQVEAEGVWLADVGFGDSFLEPLRLDAGEAVQNGEYRLTGAGAERVLERRREAGWEPQYRFALTPRRLEDFAEACGYQQYAPESPFRGRAVCSRATPEGRVTLANNRLIVTAAGRREEREVAGEDEYRKVLRESFGIELEAGAEVGRILRFGLGSQKNTEHTE